MELNIDVYIFDLNQKYSASAAQNVQPAHDCTPV